LGTSAELDPVPELLTQLNEQVRLLLAAAENRGPAKEHTHA
jgi:hypothetical protein